MPLGTLERGSRRKEATESPCALLRDGRERWNAFRRNHPRYIVVNGARLAEAKLDEIDLHCTILMESDLRRASLRGALMERGILRNSDFRGADLRRAILDGADLCRANFAGADLRGASLVSAFLKRADFTGADLSTAEGLTAIQIIEAYGDGGTRLPGHLARPASWQRLS
ncbi:MAG TPA: pentapeptide repeat-containing protein [Bryobacteraceae bacterium]|nr:pentapeptide repeat-containing protein [Bryobacteraceae bacterium]